jgi:hypothetical protein
MPKSSPIVIALLVHSIFALVIVPVVAIPRWPGFTILGITATFLVFTLHAVGIFGILKRFKWGYTFSRWVFSFYLVTSGFGLLIRLSSVQRLASPSKALAVIAEGAIFFIVFMWLYMRFRSDSSVRAYFDHGIAQLSENDRQVGNEAQPEESREERMRRRFESRNII